MNETIEAITERTISVVARLLDRAPLPSFSRGVVKAAIRSAAKEAYIEGQTAEHALSVTRKASK